MEPINVSNYEGLAQAHMDPAVWDYYQGGSDDELTLRANRTVFERIKLRPRISLDESLCDLRMTVMNTHMSMPKAVLTGR